MPFPWLKTVQGAAAVSVASRRGILDALARGEAVELPALLHDLLAGAGVLRRTVAPPELTPSFAAAWARDASAITACADFLLGAASDVAGNLEGMIYDIPSFMRGSRTFQLFRYDKALGTSDTHLAATRPWVSYLEALARQEAPRLVPQIPLARGERLLEVGGNTGVMAAALLSTYEGVTATVMDLPAVCALGQVAPWATGITFAAGDARKADAFDSFAGATDVVLFKSVLHDWPEKDVCDILGRAIDILPQNGRIVVCERGAFGPEEAASQDAQTLANLVFSPFYRPPDLYAEIMSDAGLQVRQSSVQLDMMFYTTTGVRT